MDENKTAIFKFVFSDDYNPKYVNGVFGEITPHGEVVLNFYCERSGVPKEQVFSLNENGGIGDLKETDPKDFKYIRYIQSGIILSKENAKGIAEWLNQLVDGNKEG